LSGGGFSPVNLVMGLANEVIKNRIFRSDNYWSLVRIEACDGSVTIEADLDESEMRNALRPFSDVVCQPHGTS
jgi:hypothetical protein